MSIQDVLAFRNQMQEFTTNPRAWVLLANPVWGRCEDINAIALFDTKEEAQAYFDQSKLPKDIEAKDRTTPDRIVRSFRPDSLLWDYNTETFDRFESVTPMVPWVDYPPIEHNPAPPSGPIPAVDGTKLDRPRYGRDYDQGFGGPKTNVSGAVPERGHTEPLTEEQKQLTEGGP